MTKTELKQAIAEIKKLVSDSYLDEAVEKLELLTKKIGDEAEDKGIQISSNWSSLDRKIDRTLIDNQTAMVRQNQMIDQILQFLRDLEKGKISKEDSLPKPIPQKKSNVQWFVLGIIMVGLLIFGSYQIFSKKSENPVSTKKEACNKWQADGIAFFKAKKYRAAESLFNQILKECKEKTVAANYLEKLATVERTKDANQGKKSQKSSPENKENSVSPQKTTQNSVPSKEVPTKPTAKETVPEIKPETKPLGNYKELYKKGLTALKSKNYEKAFEQFLTAQKVRNTDEVQRAIIDLREKLYRKYFSKGMDYYNVKDFKNGLEQFQIAQSYKDILQVKGMITRCNRQL